MAERPGAPRAARCVTTALDLAQHWTVIQAVARGVSRAQLSDVAPDGWFRIVRPPAGVEPSRTVAFARGELGASYGYLSVASIALNILPPRWFKWPIRFRETRTWECAALAGESARFGGWHHRWATIYGVTPAQVMHALIASGGTEIPLATARPGDVGFSHGTGFVSWAIRFAQRVNREQDWEVNHAFVIEKFTPTRIATLHPPTIERTPA